jgi:hypothetical protein
VNMSRSSSILWMRAAAAGTAVVLAASPARSSEYSCRVPRALLCEGCASQIAITLQPGGNCRISFTPDSPAAHPAAEATEPLEFRVEAAPIVVARPRAIWRPRAVAFARPTPSERCFVFNALKYCE